MKIDNNVLLPYVRRAISGAIKIKKIILVNYNYLDTILTLYICVSEKLSENEMEELYVATTEILADFPDGELTDFKYEEIIKRVGQIPIVPGTNVYKNEVVFLDS